MSTNTIVEDFRNKVCERIALEERGLDRFQVHTPFRYDDGDHFVVVLRKEDDAWVLADEGHTFMYLSYRMNENDLQKGNRAKIIDRVLSQFSVADREGELVLPVPDERWGDALYSFLQAIVKVSDITYLSREVVRSTFYEDFRTFFETDDAVAPKNPVFDWHSDDHDPQSHYKVDCRLEGREHPVFVFAMSSDSQVRDATIAIHQFERWAIDFEAIGVFENQEEINRKVLARFSDVCGKQFSNLYTNKERIHNYVARAA